MWYRILLVAAVTRAVKTQVLRDSRLPEIYRRAETVCPCTPNNLCPHYYGSSPFDILNYGNLPPCTTFGRVRCCKSHPPVGSGIEADVLTLNPSRIFSFQGTKTDGSEATQTLTKPAVSAASNVLNREKGSFPQSATNFNGSGQRSTNSNRSGQRNSAIVRGTSQNSILLRPHNDSQYVLVNNTGSASKINSHTNIGVILSRQTGDRISNASTSAFRIHNVSKPDNTSASNSFSVVTKGIGTNNITAVKNSSTIINDFASNPVGPSRTGATSSLVLPFGIKIPQNTGFSKEDVTADGFESNLTQVKNISAGTLIQVSENPIETLFGNRTGNININRGSSNGSSDTNNRSTSNNDNSRNTDLHSNLTKSSTSNNLLNTISGNSYLQTIGGNSYNALLHSSKNSHARLPSSTFNAFPSSHSENPSAGQNVSALNITSGISFRDNFYAQTSGTSNSSSLYGNPGIFSKDGTGTNIYSSVNGSLPLLNTVHSLSPQTGNRKNISTTAEVSTIKSEQVKHTDSHSDLKLLENSVLETENISTVPNGILGNSQRIQSDSTRGGNSSSATFPNFGITFGSLARTDHKNKFEAESDGLRESFDEEKIIKSSDDKVVTPINIDATKNLDASSIKQSTVFPPTDDASLNENGSGNKEDSQVAGSNGTLQKHPEFSKNVSELFESLHSANSSAKDSILRLNNTAAEFEPESSFQSSAFVTSFLPVSTRDISRSPSDESSVNGSHKSEQLLSASSDSSSGTSLNNHKTSLSSENLSNTSLNTPGLISGKVNESSIKILNFIKGKVNAISSGANINTTNPYSNFDGNKVIQNANVSLVFLEKMNDQNSSSDYETTADNIADTNLSESVTDNVAAFRPKNNSSEREGAVENSDGSHIYDVIWNPLRTSSHTSGTRNTSALQQASRLQWVPLKPPSVINETLEVKGLSLDNHGNHLPSESHSLRNSTRLSVEETTNGKESESLVIQDAVKNFSNFEALKLFHTNLTGNTRSGSQPNNSKTNETVNIYFPLLKSNATFASLQSTIKFGNQSKYFLSNSHGPSAFTLNSNDSFINSFNRDIELPPTDRLEIQSEALNVRENSPSSTVHEVTSLGNSIPLQESLSDDNLTVRDNIQNISLSPLDHSEHSVSPHSSSASDNTHQSVILFDDTFSETKDNVQSHDLLVKPNPYLIINSSDSFLEDLEVYILVSEPAKVATASEHFPLLLKDFQLSSSSVPVMTLSASLEPSPSPSSPSFKTPSSSLFHSALLSSSESEQDEANNTHDPNPVLTLHFVEVPPTASSSSLTPENPESQGSSSSDTSNASVLAFLANIAPLALEDEVIDKDNLFNQPSCRIIPECYRRYGDHPLDACVYGFLPLCRKGYVRCLDNYIGPSNMSCIEDLIFYRTNSLSSGANLHLLSALADIGDAVTIQDIFPGSIQTFSARQTHYDEEESGTTEKSGTINVRCAKINLCNSRYGSSSEDVSVYGYLPECPKGEVRCLDGASFLLPELSHHLPKGATEGQHNFYLVK